MKPKSISRNRPDRPPRRAVFVPLVALALAVSCTGEAPREGGTRPAVGAAAASDAGPAGEDEAKVKTAAASPWAALDVPRAHFPHVTGQPLKEPVVLADGKGSSVLLVVVDAFNAGHTSLYGYERPTTPNLEALAADGVFFTNWVSNSSWTRPSFTTIITGLPKSVHEVELTGQNLSGDIVTMAELFKAAGYRTAGFVGNPLVREIWGFDQGFELYEDTADHKAFPRGRELVDKAIAWLRKEPERPFFALVFMTDPHTPYRPVPEHRGYLEKVKGKPMLDTEYPLKEYRRPLPKATHDTIVAAYDGEVAYADEQIGRLVESLRALGLADRTSVVVTADHGEIFGEHNCYLHGYHMWEPVLRVPLIVSSPYVPVRGVYEDRPHTHVDLLPTVARLAGVAVPPDKTGTPVWTAMAGGEKDGEREIYSQYNAHGIHREAVRKGRWKLIHHHRVDPDRLKSLGSQSRDIPQADPKDLPSLAVDGERWELYDLLDDPGEVNDLWDRRRHDPLVEELATALVRLGGVEAPSSEPAGLSEETLQALEAAGYIVRDKKDSKPR